MTWQEQMGVAFVSGVPALTLGVLAYRRSRHTDAIAQQSGAVTETRAGTTQIIEGLNSLIDNLQEDNKSFREDVRHCGTRLEALTQERDDLRRELAILRRKYGENGHPLPSS